MNIHIQAIVQYIRDRFIDVTGCTESYRNSIIESIREGGNNISDVADTGTQMVAEYGVATLSFGALFYQHVWRPFSNHIVYTAGFLAGMWTDIKPLVNVVFVAIILDMISAVRLARRVKKMKVIKDHRYIASGKFSSVKFARVIRHMMAALISISFAYMIQQNALRGVDIYLVNGVTCALLLRHILSILENNSSCNDSKWAIIAQKIILDKTERHFDVDLNVVRDMMNLDEKLNEMSQKDNVKIGDETNHNNDCANRKCTNTDCANNHHQTSA